MSKEQSSNFPVHAVFMIDERPATTSLRVAECFDKEHKNVLADIRVLIAQCPEEFTKLNFQPSEYIDPTGRKLPMYNIYFDGFILLVMGYTGPKALKMKLAYIEAFNKMREKLEAKTAPALPDWFRPEDGERLAGTIKREPFGKIRMLVRDNVLWFAGVDICRYSGRSWSGTLRTTLLPKDCKLLIKTHFGFSPNGKGLLMVREDFVKWLFDLKCQNRSLKFEEWFFGGGLPVLRKHFGARELPALAPRELLQPKRLAEKHATGPVDDTAIDPVTYEYKKRLFDQLADLLLKAENLRETIHLFGRPGARNPVLSTEKQVLYENMYDCVNGAVTGMNIAI